MFFQTYYQEVMPNVYNKRERVLWGNIITATTLGIIAFLGFNFIGIDLLLNLYLQI